MPLFVVTTNLPKDKIPKTFLTDSSKVIANLLEKPEKYVCIRVHTDEMMTFGGSDAACALVELESLGKVGGELNKKLVPILGKHVEEKLGIPQDRFYIKITDVPRANMGYNGNTFG